MYSSFIYSDTLTNDTGLSALFLSRVDLLLPQRALSN